MSRLTRNMCFTLRSAESHASSHSKPDAWGDSGRLHYTTPIVATMTKCDTDLPQLRFALDPSVPAAQGSRRLAA